MSGKRPGGHQQDSERTAFGQCMAAARTAARTPRGRAAAPGRPDPTRPGRGGLPTGGESPTLTALARELFQMLDSGVASCSEMRNGRPWPRPKVEGVRRLVGEYDEATCLRAAREAREIVQSQDRAPNVTALFEKKCADVAAERRAVRDEIRKALA
jgi:hypothetical protein